jgi:hypothetical protein
MPSCGWLMLVCFFVYSPCACTLLGPQAGSSDHLWCGDHCNWFKPLKKQWQHQSSDARFALDPKARSSRHCLAFKDGSKQQSNRFTFSLHIHAGVLGMRILEGHKKPLSLFWQLDIQITEWSGLRHSWCGARNQCWWLYILHHSTRRLHQVQGCQCN